MLEFRELDISDLGQLKKAVALREGVFGHGNNEAELLHRVVDSHPNSKFLAAFDGNRMAGMNGFIAHPVCRNGETSIAYQSCDSATNPDYRGKGVFSSLINLGKELLKDQGGAFLFGYPNKNSGPIFTRKLGFYEEGMSLIYLPAVFCETLSRRMINLDRLTQAHGSDSRHVFFDARQTAEWKRKRHGPDLIEIEMYNNFLFGVLSRTRFGLILNVGGYEFHKPELVPELIARAVRQTGVRFIRFVVSDSGALATAARFVRSGKNTEPLITYPLNWDLIGCNIESYTGLKDVY